MCVSSAIGRVVVNTELVLDRAQVIVVFTACHGSPGVGPDEEPAGPGKLEYSSPFH